MRELSTAESLIRVIRENHSFLISGHVRPDADALGSTIALGLALKNAGKNVLMVNEDPFPGNLKYLPHADEVVQAQLVESVSEKTVFIAVDTATRQRLGEHVIALMEQCVCSVNIDHHISNELYGDIPYVDPEQPATGAILHDLLREMNLPITPAIRDALYIAISTDTGSFQYKGTSAHTMEIAADLIRKGVDVPELNRKMYDEHPWRRTLLMKAVLDELHRTDDGKICYTFLSNKTKEALDVQPEDTEGLINLLRSIEGVKVAAFFEEIENDDRIRVSLRSKDPRVNVSEIAQRFGGGGHPMASGLRKRGAIQDVGNIVLAVLQEEVDKLPV